MNTQQIADQRLANEFLLNNLNSPAKVVGGLGAVQAQDFWGACWALGRRTGKTEAEIVADFNAGKILRTHILRPTWHFVSPSDIRWMLELTGPRVLATTKSYYKKTNLTDEILQKSARVLRAALKGKQLTRIEIKQIYEAAKIDTSGLKLGFLLMYAELTALICSGALNGKQHTYTLISERAPQAKSLPREEALAKLTELFFTSHGPATIKDLGWWSTLTVADIKQGIAAAKLESFEIDGQTFYYKNKVKAEYKKPLINLLPNYDEMLVGYKIRVATIGEGLERSPSFEDLSYHIITENGRVIGGWKKQIVKDVLKIKLNLFKKLDRAEQGSLDEAVEKLQSYSGLKIDLS